MPKFGSIFFIAISFQFCSQANAETKNDILGFTTGATVEQVNANLLTQFVSCDPLKEFRLSCTSPIGLLSFRFTNNAKPPRVIEVRSTFSSDDSPEEMMQSVAKQFGLQPTSLLTYDTTTNTKAYIWNLQSTDPKILFLTMSKPPQLILYSGKLDREDMEFNKIPTPKF